MVGRPFEDEGRESAARPVRAVGRGAAVSASGARGPERDAAASRRPGAGARRRSLPSGPRQFRLRTRRKTRTRRQQQERPGHEVKGSASRHTRGSKAIDGSADDHQVGAAESNPARRQADGFNARCVRGVLERPRGRGARPARPRPRGIEMRARVSLRRHREDGRREQTLPLACQQKRRASFVAKPSTGFVSSSAAAPRPPRG